MIIGLQVLSVVTNWHRHSLHMFKKYIKLFLTKSYLKCMGGEKNYPQSQNATEQWPGVNRSLRRWLAHSGSLPSLKVGSLPCQDGRPWRGPLAFFGEIRVEVGPITDLNPCCGLRREHTWRVSWCTSFCETGMALPRLSGKARGLNDRR